ncbi:MAG: tRNA uridine(34) 5-carboxymethylaminomethyl modification radical SAM/GNAT enzyme Elp3 [Promethearchaeota archaeon]
MKKEEKLEKAARSIIQFLMEHPDYKKNKITPLKNRFVKKYALRKTMKNSQIIRFATDDELTVILPVLMRRSTRSISGVIVVAVMTKPLKCPGNCIYCPGEYSQPGEKAAKSYTGQEPAAKRSIMYDYDPFLQTRNRLLDLKAIGHKIDKVELIIMGGTFPSTPAFYQTSFINGCYEALNHFFEPKFNHRIQSPDSLEIIFEKEKKAAEHAKIRLVGITVETRPDYCLPKHVNCMLNYGCTRVEIGIQTTRESILKNLNRGHSIQQSIDAIKYSKDAGLKVNAHMMPNLPGSTPKEDIKDLNNLFDDPNFRPDMLKIYPTLVIKGTELYRKWKNGEYNSYPLDTTVNLIAQFKINIPKYVRIQRIQRDIPAYLIVDGVKKSNLRQIIQKHLVEKGQKCNCIRCREQGFIDRSINQKGIINSRDFDSFKLNRIDYQASEGTEIFLSYENEQALLGYLRLRKPSRDVFRPELKTEKTFIVREIKVVGELVPHQIEPKNYQVQHRGYGKALLTEAERITKEEFDVKKISVISGIGVREYFYEQGYFLDGVYMSKKL